MKVTLSLADASPSELKSLAEAMLEVAEEKGLAVALPERTKPYLITEACGELNLGRSSVNLLIKAGSLVRIKGLDKVLITASSLHAYREGLV